MENFCKNQTEVSPIYSISTIPKYPTAQEPFQGWRASQLLILLSKRRKRSKLLLHIPNTGSKLEKNNCGHQYGLTSSNANLAEINLVTRQDRSQRCCTNEQGCTLKQLNGDREVGELWPRGKSVLPMPQVCIRCHFHFLGVAIQTRYFKCHNWETVSNFPRVSNIQRAWFGESVASMFWSELCYVPAFWYLCFLTVSHG